MLETYERKGLVAVSVMGYLDWMAIAIGGSYYNDVREESVEKDDVLNAGHCVESFKGMQLCAVALGAVAASAVRRVAQLMNA